MSVKPVKPWRLPPLNSLMCTRRRLTGRGYKPSQASHGERLRDASKAPKPLAACHRFVRTRCKNPAVDTQTCRSGSSRDSSGALIRL
jgi:hypothetical protein